MEIENQKWTFEKRISIGDILAIVTALIAVLYAYTTLDRRLSILETLTAIQTTNDAKQDIDRLTIKQDLRDDLGRLQDDITEIRRILTKSTK